MMGDKVMGEFTEAGLRRDLWASVDSVFDTGRTPDLWDQRSQRVGRDAAGWTHEPAGSVLGQAAEWVAEEAGGAAVDLMVGLMMDLLGGILERLGH